MITIYLFSDEDGYPIYVGKAKNLKYRIKQHYRDRLKYDTPFYRWLNKQISLNKQWFIDTLEECDDIIWQEKESYWISHFRNFGVKLKNCTEGGDGHKGFKQSKKTIKKRKIAISGFKHSEETKRKISESSKCKKLSEETKEKLRNINLGKLYTEEIKLKTSKAVIAINIINNSILEFASLTKASEFLNTRKSTLQNIITKKSNRTFKGYIWNYK